MWSWSVCALICCCCVLQTHHCNGQSLVGSVRPLLAALGHDVVLPCSLRPPKDVSGLTLEWTRSEPGPEVVLVWQSHRDFREVKSPRFRDRSSVFQDELKKGNVSLRLKSVRAEDGGSYRCSVPSEQQKTTVRLVISVPGSPALVSVSAVHVWSSALELHCESKGWFPKPELQWLNSEGKALPDEGRSLPDEGRSLPDEGRSLPDEGRSLSGPVSLLNVSSRLRVDHSGSFTCRVTSNNSSTHQTITLTDGVFAALVWIPPSFVALTVVSIVSVGFAVALSFLYCANRHGNIERHDNQQQLRDVEDRLSAALEELKMLRSKQELADRKMPILQTENETLKNEQEKSKARIKGLTSRVKSLESTVLKLREDTKTLETSLDSSSKAMRRLEEEKGNLQAELDSSKTMMSRLTEEKEKLKTEQVHVL